MKRVPPDYHISPVGTHAGDRISKKTVPGPFEVPRKLYGNSSLLGSIPGPRPLCRTSPPRREALQAEELEPMTGKMQVKKSWQLAEQHGLWWAYEGDLPPPEAFQTHGRPRYVPILGPYPSRTIAEALLRRHLARCRD
jgi:hypothetical protein